MKNKSKSKQQQQNPTPMADINNQLQTFHPMPESILSIVFKTAISDNRLDPVEFFLVVIQFLTPGKESEMCSGILF